ncbi:hypothetical protein ACFX5K_04540 [Rickettsiales bacterium LUAb2]
MYSDTTYKDYEGTDIITFRMQLGYSKASANFSKFAQKNTENGIDVLVDTNIFYNIKYLNRFYIGVNIISFSGNYFNGKIASAVLSYDFKIPKSNIYIGLGAGVGKQYYNSINYEKLPEAIDIKFKNNNIKQVYINSSYFLQRFGYPNWGIYSNLKIIYSNNIENDYNNKYNNYLAAIGFLYKINYLVN